MLTLTSYRWPSFIVKTFSENFLIGQTLPYTPPAILITAPLFMETGLGGSAEPTRIRIILDDLHYINVIYLLEKPYPNLYKHEQITRDGGPLLRFVNDVH